MAGAESSGFWINNILDRLSWELTGVLRDNLAVEDLSRQRLDLQLLLTLSKRVYVERLLFRDFHLPPGATVHRLPAGGSGNVAQIVHEQAIEYVYKVLGRPLTLAQNLRDKPTNMHVLFELLCQYGPAGAGWPSAQIRRDIGVSAGISNTLAPVAKRLERQRIALGDGYSEISARRREQYGPYWLLVGESAVEMPEEMSLFDVLEALPKPLDAGFVEARGLQNQLNRVLKSLNERYMLLRSCGLGPNTWLDRSWPSIANLRDMKQLLRKAQTALGEGVERDPVTACERAFEALKGSRKKFAGYATFSELALDEAGVALLRRRPSFDDAAQAEIETPAAIDAEDDLLDSGGQVETLIRSRPDLFDAPMTYFFRQAVARGRNVRDVLLDPTFRRLVSCDPAYSAINEDALVCMLRRKAQDIVKRGVQTCAPRTQAS